MFLVVHRSGVFHQDSDLGLIENSLRDDTQHPPRSNKPQVEFSVGSLSVAQLRNAAYSVI